MRTILILGLMLMANLAMADQQSDIIQQFGAAEQQARTSAGLPPMQPSIADHIINNAGQPTTRTGMSFATTSAIMSPGGTPIPGPTLIPPGLAVKFTGDTPDTGFCDFYVAPTSKSSDPKNKNPTFPPQGCNDKVSGVLVPFGLGARICADDGHDGSGDGFGACQDFSPSPNLQYVGSLNDKGTTFWAWDDQMVFYLTTDGDEVPDNCSYSIGYDFDNNQGLTGGVSVGIKCSASDYIKSYAFQLPGWCQNPTWWQTTQSGDSSATEKIEAGYLKIRLRVGRTQAFNIRGANWIGLGVRCQ